MIITRSFLSLTADFTIFILFITWPPLPPLRYLPPTKYYKPISHLSLMIVFWTSQLSFLPFSLSACFSWAVLNFNVRFLPLSKQNFSNLRVFNLTQHYFPLFMVCNISIPHHSLKILKAFRLRPEVLSTLTYLDETPWSMDARTNERLAWTQDNISNSRI